MEPPDPKRLDIHPGIELDEASVDEAEGVADSNLGRIARSVAGHRAPRAGVIKAPQPLRAG